MKDRIFDNGATWAWGPLLCVLLLAACGGGEAKMDTTSDAYGEVVSAFYTGVTAVSVGEGRLGEEELLAVTEMAPQEPAAWANLGLLALRRNEYELAAERLGRARELAPEEASILLMSGVLARAQGRTADAVAFLRRAAAADPRDARVRYALAEVLAADDPDAAHAALDTVQVLRPGNLAVLVERARLAAQAGDAPALRAAVDSLGAEADAWPLEVRERYDALRAAVAAGGGATEVTVLQNVLRRLPAYREDLEAVQTPPELGAELITRFLRLPQPDPRPAPPDDSLSFFPEPLASVPWGWVGAFILDDQALPAVVGVAGDELWIGDDPELAYPAGAAGAPPAPHAVAGIDFNYDFRLDLAAVGPGGLRLYRQDDDGGFVDATSSLGLPATITRAPYAGVWGADLDLEGDLDLVLSAPDGAPRVLRNDGDGTFSVWEGYFADVERLRDFGWADLDADGDPDALLLDAGGMLHVYENRRSRGFRPWPTAAPVGRTLAFDVADLNADGRLDVALLQADGALVRRQVGPDGWQDERIAERTPLAGVSSPRLFAADLDNNGGLDLLVADATRNDVWLRGQDGGYRLLETAPEGRVFGLADLAGEGRLDLLALVGDGMPTRLVNQGTKPYYARSMRPRAAEAFGDRRINPFGIGGEVELRAGLLFQKQPVTDAVVHFGLGEHAVVDVARIIWPNGDVQAEFDLEADQLMLTRQRLKGSCPWLFTHDGEGMQFVTDFIWRSPLGLAINAQETAGVMTTEDWVKIRGDQMVPRDGYYDLRITAELWETHFFDHISLLVVDHPVGTEVYVDERFAFPPPPAAVHATAPVQPVVGAWDDAGRDVLPRVAARDGRYLGGFAPGPYQGVAVDHYVEVALGPEAPTDGPLWLVAAGWVRPTDSSINVALSQGSTPPPDGLRLEVPDGSGGWRVAREGLGFPSGKEKTILVDLTGLIPEGAPPRVRLGTNLEVYWDALGWAVPLPGADLRTTRLDPASADLRYRGFSVVTEDDRTTPERPHYEQLNGTAPVWRDLVGYYTRFGDVRELLGAVDDRYVIMNAGDEMAFRFAAPPPPPEGWTRDFVLVGDGWVKDGDYNTTFSETVLPLPAHDLPLYDAPPGRLEDDPVYRRHPEDWQTYHTRYVTPDRFVRGMQLGGQ